MSLLIIGGIAYSAALGYAFALARVASQPGEAEAKVGRNERCPCGSGLKYKHSEVF